MKLNPDYHQVFFILKFLLWNLCQPKNKTFLISQENSVFVSALQKFEVRFRTVHLFIL